MKTLHALVIICDVEEITDDVLSKINNVLAVSAGAENVVCTQMDTEGIVSSILEKTTHVKVSKSRAKYNKNLNDALDFVKNKFANYLTCNEPFLLASAFLHDQNVDTAFRIIANSTMDEVQKCPAYSQTRISERFIVSIKKIVEQLG